jgi:PAS domain S-box-containing protein
MATTDCSPARNTLRILVVEDDPDTREDLCDVLKLDGHEVYSAASYTESIALSDAYRFGLVITDRRLPEGMIEDFLPSVKMRSSQADIIVITGFADLQSTIAALRLGVSDYVVKPIIPDDIRAIVNRMAEQHRLRIALVEEHHFADEVLKTAEAIILVLDLGGRVIRFNPYFQQIAGWTIEDLAGQDWFQYCLAEKDQAAIKEVFIRTAQDIHTRGIVNDILCKDGSILKIRWSNTTLKNAHGDIHSVLAVGVDITDLAEAQSRSLQAERLAAIGQTMTALAHESRNVLQRIRAAADLLELEMSANQDASESLEVIKRASSDLQCLLEEVRSFAAPIQLHRTHANLPDVWKRAWADLTASRNGRQASLVTTVVEGDFTCQLDTVRMEQVFRNLFENSLAAAADPVTIKVECRSKEDWIELLCRDNGPGLNHEQRQRLFEPFYTTKKTGTGLGLSICQRIIEAHDGSIRIDGSGEGACFLIRLPRSVIDKCTKPLIDSPPPVCGVSSENRTSDSAKRAMLEASGCNDAVFE